jgi:pimeloyl-ACP methyl ester carboxylesterase
MQKGKCVALAFRMLCVVMIAAGFLAAAQAQQPPVKGRVPYRGAVPPGKTAPLPPGRVPPGYPNRAPQPKALPAKTQPPRTQPKGPKIPEPEDVKLTTKDGVTLTATYYPGTAKKETVPIIMIHDIDGQRGDYHGLASYLQTFGYASIVPDLRGHGQSRTQTYPNGNNGTIDGDKLKGPALEACWLDIEACKKFLLEKNNEGELNIDQLCVIGAEFGGILAVRWAAKDWSWPALTSQKQGQDVKAIVLLSPQASYKGVAVRDALTSPAVRTQFSFMLVAGEKDTKATAEAKKLQKELQSQRPKVSDDDSDRNKLKEVFLIQPDVSLSGTKLLASGTGVPGNIARFIELRLVNRKADFPWQDRSNPLGK